MHENNKIKIKCEIKVFYWYIKFTSKLISSLKTNIIAFKTLKIKKIKKTLKIVQLI